jgi:hypothetical protein
MNKQEAQSVLRRYLGPYVTQSYEQLGSLIGSEHVSKVSGPSGMEYHFEVYAEHVNEDDNTIEVEGIVTEAKGRWWFPASVHESFVVGRDGKKYSRCGGLLEDIEPSAAPNDGTATQPGSPGGNAGPPSVS